MYPAVVLEVLVASPSDTSEQRRVIRGAVVDWNVANSRYFGVVLLPVMWETHTYPDLSGRPQGIVNKQIVDDADILVATLWTSLGTPTGEAESGTVEEIDRFIESGRKVLLYFCDMPSVLLDSDTSELEKLKSYRKKVKDEGLFSSYKSMDELREKVRDDLTKLVHDLREGGSLESVGQTEPSEPQATDSDGSAVSWDRDPTERLAQLHRSLTGWLHKWETVLGGLEDDYSVDSRHKLMSDVQDVVLEVVRLVASEAPRSPVLPQLSGITRSAGQWAQFRVYMDGGKTFGELTDGCRDVIEAVRQVLELPWTNEA